MLNFHAQSLYYVESDIQYPSALSGHQKACSGLYMVIGKIIVSMVTTRHVMLVCIFLYFVNLHPFLLTVNLMQFGAVCKRLSDFTKCPQISRPKVIRLEIFGP